MYNYLIISADWTSIVISASTSECKLILTLNFPIDLISLIGCIIDGLISNWFSWLIILEISVGFTEPYNSLFSVLSFFIRKIFLFNFSNIDLAFCFFSLSDVVREDLIFYTSDMFSL